MIYNLIMYLLLAVNTLYGCTTAFRRARSPYVPAYMMQNHSPDLGVPLGVVAPIG